MSSESASRAAYGLRITGVQQAASMLVTGDPDWPQLDLVAEIDDPEPMPESLTRDRAELTLKTGGRLSVDRNSGVARFMIPRPVSDDELVHPYLAPAAAVMCHWAGRLTFHAGAFVADGGVWGLVGEREAGKSSTLAWMAARDIAIVADDVLVLGDGRAFTGPRSIDLRRETAERFRVGEALGMVGTRPRWRVTLGQMPSSLPFRGWVFLQWGETSMRRLPPSESLPSLVKNLTLRVDATDPAAVVGLATYPAFSFRRPKEWGRLDESMDLLLSAVHDA